jgi:hypothetical protein
MREARSDGRNGSDQPYDGEDVEDRLARRRPLHDLQPQISDLGLILVSVRRSAISVRSSAIWVFVSARRPITSAFVVNSGNRAVRKPYISSMRGARRFNIARISLTSASEQPALPDPTRAADFRCQPSDSRRPERNGWAWSSGPWPRPKPGAPAIARWT